RPPQTTAAANNSPVLCSSTGRSCRDGLNTKLAAEKISRPQKSFQHPSPHGGGAAHYDAA
ncbi:MAG: hypothetical protein RSB42_07600, partial [Comamonas sp.]